MTSTLSSSDLSPPVTNIHLEPLMKVEGLSRYLNKFLPDQYISASKRGFEYPLKLISEAARRW